MNNNDILRRIRYTFDFNDTKMIEIFGLADYEVTRGQISDWMKKEDDPSFINMDDYHLAVFLNGFINEKRGKKEGAQTEAEKRLNNNIIFRKLKIALTLKDDDIVAIFDLVNMRVSKGELTAFFRNPNQEKYKLCNDQFLRNFLHGIQVKYKASTK